MHERINKIISDDARWHISFSPNYVDELAKILGGFSSEVAVTDDLIRKVLGELFDKQHSMLLNKKAKAIIENILDAEKNKPKSVSEELEERYKEIDKVEYSDPSEEEKIMLPAENKLPIKVRKTQANLSQQIQLDLKKRALSFCHGAYILLQSKYENDPSKLNHLMNQIFGAADAFIKNLETKKPNLEDPKNLKSYLEELNRLTTEMALILSQFNGDVPSIEGIHSELVKAEMLANCERRKPCVIMTPINVTNISLYQVETILANKFTDEQKEELDIKETWYEELSPVQRYWFDKNKSNLINGTFAASSTLISNLPGCANVSRYELIDKASKQKLITSIGRRTLAPMKVKSRSTRLKLATQNGEEILSIAEPAKARQAFWAHDIPPLMLEQSLLSPLQTMILRNLEKFSSDDNNSEMLEAVKTAYKEKQNVITTNWPINTARMFSLGFDDPYNKSKDGDKFKNHFRAIFEKLGFDSKKAIDAIISELIANNKNNQINSINIFLPGDAEKTEKLERFHLALLAYKEYRKIFNDRTLREKHKGRNPELFMASLERLMVDGTGGIISSGCKSAKDREGLAKMHTTAMILYYKKHKELPLLDDVAEKRNNFAEVFGEVHISGHQQHMANLNCYGAEGCQNGMSSLLQKLINVVKKIDIFNLFDPQPMLPADLKGKVGENREKCQDLIARSNRVKFDHDYATRLLQQPKTYPSKLFVPKGSPYRIARKLPQGQSGDETKMPISSPNPIHSASRTSKKTASLQSSPKPQLKH